MSSSFSADDLYQQNADNTSNDNALTGKENGDTVPITPGIAPVIQLGEISPLHIEDSSATKKENSETLKIIIVSSVVFSVAILISLVISIIYSPAETNGYSKAVVSNSRYCSAIGADVLDNGGNAVDAAVASCFCEGVVSMHVTGLGGGGYLLLRRKEQKDSKSFNFIPSTPESNYDITDEVGTAVGVPGTLHGLYTAHQMYGSKNWKDLITPSVNLARDGFIISKELSDYLSSLAPSVLSTLTTSTNTSQGQTVTLTPLASSLELIANSGLSEFYSGSIRDAVIQQGYSISCGLKHGLKPKPKPYWVNNNGGDMKLSDYTQYGTINTDTVSISYKDMIIETSPSPSSGPILALILNVLDTFTITSEDFKDYLLVHKLIEVIKHGMGNLYKIGDNPNSKDDIDEMLSSEFTAKVSSAIGNQTLDWSEYTGDVFFKVAEVRGANIIIKDDQSNYVAVVSSLGDISNTKLVASGFLLNNALLSFENSSMNNVKASFRRPAFYLAAALVHSDDRPCGIEAAFASSVNAVSIGDMAQVIVRLLAYKMNITDAISMNRFQFPISLGNVTYDGKVSNDLLKSLLKRGHNPTPVSPLFMDPVCGVSYINDTVAAGVDYRGTSSKDVR